MQRWFEAGDEEFAPEQLPAVVDGAGYVVHQGRLFLLGGFGEGWLAELDTVISYSPATNTWTSHEPLSDPASFYTPCVSHGEYIYGVRSDGEFIRYHPTSGETELGDIGEWGLDPPVLVGSRVYCRLMTPQPIYYDIDAGTFHDAAGTSPFTEAMFYGAAVEYKGAIVVIPPLAEDAWLYDPARGRWSPLPGPPVPFRYGALVKFRDRILAVTGDDAEDNAVTDLWVLNARLSAWMRADVNHPIPDWVSGAGVGVVLGRLVLAGGYAHWQGVPADIVMMYGEPLNALEGIVSVPLWEPAARGEAQIMMEVDVDGGPGQAAELPMVLMTGGRQVEAPVDVEADIAESAAIIPPITEPGEPIEGDEESIVDPGDGGWVGDIERERGLTSSYSMNHALGGGATGRAESPYRNEFFIPEHVPMPPILIEEAGYTWSHGGDIQYRRAYADVAAEEALGTTILDELMPLDQIRAWHGGDSPICLFPLDAGLCEGVGAPDPDTGVMPGPEDPVLPTRLQLARSAASAAGVDLVLYAGPGLWAADRRVPVEYRTEGKTAMQVVQEMLLVSNPRTWYSLLSMHIDGRVLPAASAASPGSWWGGEPGDPNGPGGHPPPDEGDGEGEGEGDGPGEMNPQPIGLEGEGTIVHDRGMRPVRELRFVSSESQGFMTPAQVRGMMELYEAGAAFELETDLLDPLGQGSRTFTARFAADSVPVFTPATHKGDLYYFDMLLLVSEAGGGEGEVV